MIRKHVVANASQSAPDKILPFEMQKATLRVAFAVQIEVAKQINPQRLTSCRAFDPELGSPSDSLKS